MNDKQEDVRTLRELSDVTLRSLVAKTVVTYQLAYLTHVSVSLCAACAEAPSKLIGVLGPVLHGAHEGRCDQCEHAAERATGEVQP